MHPSRAFITNIQYFPTLLELLFRRSKLRQYILSILFGVCREMAPGVVRLCMYVCMYVCIYLFIFARIWAQ